MQVSNSTAKSDLATSASTGAPKRHGFNVTAPDDYPKRAAEVPATKVMFSAGNEQAAATVAASFANPKVERGHRDGRHRAGGARPGLQHSVTVLRRRPVHRCSVHVQSHGGTSSPPTKLPDDLTVTNAADTTCE